MPGEQTSLFDRKKYSGVLPQTYQIEPPAADSTVLKTLPAYHTYLQSGEYSKYTPDDFTGRNTLTGGQNLDKPPNGLEVAVLQYTAK